MSSLLVLPESTFHCRKLYRFTLLVYFKSKVAISSINQNALFQDSAKMEFCSNLYFLRRDSSSDWSIRAYKKEILFLLFFNLNCFRNCTPSLVCSYFIRDNYKYGICVPCTCDKWLLYFTKFFKYDLINKSPLNDTASNKNITFDNV